MLGGEKGKETEEVIKLPNGRLITREIAIPPAIENVVFRAFLCYKTGKLFRDGDLSRQRRKELDVLFWIIKYIDRKHMLDWCELLFGKDEKGKK